MARYTVETSPRTRTRLLTSKEVMEAFGWEWNHLIRNTNQYVGADQGYLDLYEFRDPQGKQIRCIFSENGDVLYDPQHYAELIRLHLM